MKIHYMGKLIEDTNQPRKKNGQYKKGLGWLWSIFVMAALFIVFIFASNWDFQEMQNGVINYTAPALAEVKPDRLEVKIESLKNELVESLAKNCETKGVAEPDAALIFDSNNQASVGAWQWQIKSVQHYAKAFTGQEITRKEAIILAMDHEKAKEFTTRVIFEQGTGHKEWVICFQKLGLKSQVEFIKSLEK